jgi:small-conductance mechanosensitive channel
MTRQLPALLCLLTLLAAPLAAAQAQIPLALTPATPAKSTAATEAAPAPPITPEQARQALDVLNDPAKRAAITATLETIARTQPAATTAATPPSTPASQPVAPLGIPFAPDSLGAAVLAGSSNVLTEAANRVTDALHAAHGLPALWAWLVTMATDPLARMLLIGLAWRLAVTLAASFAVMWCIARALRPPLRHVGRRLIRMPPATAARLRAMRRAADAAPDAALDLAPDLALDQPEDADESGEARAEHGETEPPAPRRFDTARLLRRVPLVLAEFALYLLPILGFVIAGHVIAGSALVETRLTRLVLLAVIDSYALCALSVALLRALLAPSHPRLRLLPVPSATAAYALRWTTRLLVVGVVGYAVAEVGLLLGLSEVAHLALIKATVLVLHIFVGIVVVQKRRVVRRWIHAPADAQGIIAVVRNRLAAIWHWIALFYLVALWLVWAAALPVGYERVSRALLIAVAIAIVARIAIRAGIAALDRLLRAGAGLATHYPGLDDRLSFYHPFLQTFVHAAVFVLALLLLLQLLGFGAFLWLVASPLGQRLTGSVIALAFTLLLALGAWESVNLAIERYLARLTQQAQIARIARLRTLLPILRSTLLVVVLTVTVLVVLSEIGVNAAPLLASAGIIGVAIGFGSQKLVQDLITGLFLLLENTMQVGDVVSVGGLSGVVEALSVRTIRLRSEDGSVYVIPFSSVTTVTNMTRDYSRAVIAVGVAYKENYDHVIEVLKGILAEMRDDPQWRVVILGDLEVWGLDQFADSAVMIKCRIMCTPFGRWSVLREFNRRMKARFDELGIEIPFPHQKLIVDQPLTIQQSLSPVPAPK